MPAAVLNSPSTDAALPSHVRLTIWLNKLPQNPLPIDTTIAKRVLRLLKNDDCDCIQLAELIKQEPALCLKLFHHCDDALRGRDGDIQHIAHLVSLLGFGQLENIIKGSQCSVKHPEGFHEIYGASLFAAQLASELLSKRHGASNERFFIPTLLYNAPLWLMWASAPKTMTQGQQMVSKQQAILFDTSQQLLGFELPELFKKAHTFVHLPEMTRKALATRMEDDLGFWGKVAYMSTSKLEKWLKQDKSAKHQFYSVETGIFLLNQYALAVYLDWNGKHIRRFTHLLCRHLKLDTQEFNTSVLDIVMHMPAPYYLKGKMSPIQRLQGLHRIEETDETLVPEEASTQTQASDNTRTKPAEKPGIEAWLKKIRASDNVESALQKTLEALSQGVGVEHCIILGVDEKKIHTQAQYGYAQESPITSFHQQRDTLKNLFSQLIQQPACVAIPPKDLDKAAKKLPAQFAQYCELKQPCGLLSVFHEDKPKALIYCDRSQWDKKTHQEFKTVGKYLSHTLKQLH